VKERNRQKDSEDTSKFWFQHNQHYRKDIGKTNQTILKNITNGDLSSSHLPSKTSESSSTIEKLVWLTCVIVGEFFLCYWIHLFKIFSMVLVVLSSKLQYAFKIIFFSFLFYLFNNFYWMLLLWKATIFKILVWFIYHLA
jgi:hypothetical protein